MNHSTTPADERINWLESIPMILMHLACFAAIWTGVDWKDVGLLLATFWARMFGITGGYHRYFAHRAYTASRPVQFALGFLGAMSSQKGPLWWAGHHRIHHRYSDQPEDRHSPKQKGFWFSHIGWILCDRFKETPEDVIRDFAKYPEIRWLNRFWYVPPTILAFATLAIGGWSGLVWGFFVSTVLLWHATFTINSLAHTMGRRRYATTDTSRNNWALALLTIGEGWHNNHHHYQAATRNGFFWWEIDVTYYVLWLMRVVGLVGDFRPVPAVVKTRTIQAQRKAMIASAKARWDGALARFEAAREEVVGRVESALGGARDGAVECFEGAREDAARRLNAVKHRFEIGRDAAVRKWEHAVGAFERARVGAYRRWDAAAVGFEKAVDEALATLEAFAEGERAVMAT